LFYISRTMISLKPSTRLRIAATVILVGGVGGACLFYWIRMRTAAPGVDELLAGYTQARERQMGIMMGGLGVTMRQWIESLQQPRTQAIIAAAVSTLVAAVCFRVATLMDMMDPGATPPPR